jgi:uncharacterized protein (TIGR02599 family)
MQRSPRAFTLVELLLSMAVLAIILGIMLEITTNTQKTCQRLQSGGEQFQAARAGFERLSRRLSQAVLNTYWDYERDAATGFPKRYIRQSELRFLSGPGITGRGDAVGHAIFFQTPSGITSGSTSATDLHSLDKLINTSGFLVVKGLPKTSVLSFLPAGKNRFHLMEFIEPSENLSIYKHTSSASNYAGTEWFTDSLGSSGFPENSYIIAENIVALVLLPKLSSKEDPTESKLAPNYLYDSTVTSPDASINPKNQLPPVVQVTMVAIDEVSALRLGANGGDEALRTKIAGLFAKASQYAADLAELETYMNKARINYKIFTENISIETARWSREQKN